MNQSPASNKGLLAGIIIIAALVFGGLVWAVVNAPSEPDGITGVDEQVTFNDAGNPSVGPADAKVVVHLYSDFQCPACRSAEPGVKHAIDTYKDRVKFVWKDFPLSQIHKNALNGANAARCAERQGKFWEYHDKLYALQPSWAELADPKSVFQQFAHDLAMEENLFINCYDNRLDGGMISRDFDEGTRNNVDRTPTFFINHKRSYGMGPAEWDKALDAALRSASSTS